MESVGALGQPGSLLIEQLEDKIRDVEWTIAHFPFVANVTTLAAECDLALSPAMSVASCHNLAQPYLAFVGNSADLLATYATFLADPGSEVFLLVDETQRTIVEQAFEVLEVKSEWQMVFRGELPEAEFKYAVRLGPQDLHAMETLAKAEKLPIETLAKDIFEQGPVFGVWDKRKLIAMGTTTVSVPGAAQIGNIIVRKECRGLGYDKEIILALVHTLMDAGLCAFLIIPQSDTEHISFFEEIDFVRERPMYFLRCRLKADEVMGHGG